MTTSPLRGRRQVTYLQFNSTDSTLAKSNFHLISALSRFWLLDFLLVLCFPLCPRKFQYFSLSNIARRVCMRTCEFIKKNIIFICATDIHTRTPKLQTAFRHKSIDSRRFGGMFTLLFHLFDGCSLSFEFFFNFLINLCLRSPKIDFWEASLRVNKMFNCNLLPPQNLTYYSGIRDI